MQFGIIGAGMIAEFHAKAIAAISGARLVAIFARRKDVGDDFSARHGCTAYSDLQAFLAHPDLQVVTICTPSGAHLEPVIAAAAAGKHIICEKPLEVTVDRIDEMIDACDHAGVGLAGIFPRRFSPAVSHLKKAIVDGRFGRISLVEATIKWWRTQAYYDSGAWRGTWDLDGGGALMNQSIHTIDLLLHLMGDADSIQADAALRAHRDIEVEDTAAAIMRFEGGALGVVQGSTACWSANGHPAEIQICGDHGSVFMSDDKFRVWEFADETSADQCIRTEFGLANGSPGAGAADPSAIDFSGHQRNFEDAISAFSAGRPPLVDGKEARRAVALIQAIYKAAHAQSSAA